MSNIPAGVWQRDWIRRHGGAEDDSVIVRYVQTPSAFGDLRIRRDRSDLSPAESFAELDDEQLAVLAGQDGFAGFTTMNGMNATWHHEIDFQPAGAADIGRIEPRGDGWMLEHALDGSYVERWSRLAGASEFLVARIERASRVEQLLVVAGEHFIYARARRAALPSCDSLGELISRTKPTRDKIIGYLDCEISYGTTIGWQIERSTLPWQKGKRMALADRIAIDALGQPVPRAMAAGEAWTFPIVAIAVDRLHTMFASPRD